jgi:hypothetical protein
MRLEHVGKFVRRAALFASTAFFATCVPSSISAPPMRSAPEGPAMADRELSVATPIAARGTLFQIAMRPATVPIAL